MKFCGIILMSLCLFSCNQSKIEELENQVSTLQNENAELRSLNSELQSQIEELQNVASSYQYDASVQASYAARLRDEQRENEWHQQIAAQHLRDAEFWAEEGNDFLYESSMRNAQNELDMMP